MKGTEFRLRPCFFIKTLPFLIFYAIRSPIHYELIFFSRVTDQMSLALRRRQEEAFRFATRGVCHPAKSETGF
jgi:hypothetical protein